MFQISSNMSKNLLKFPILEASPSKWFVSVLSSSICIRFIHWQIQTQSLRSLYTQDRDIKNKLFFWLNSNVNIENFLSTSNFLSSLNWSISNTHVLRGETKKNAREGIKEFYPSSSPPWVILPLSPQHGETTLFLTASVVRLHLRFVSWAFVLLSPFAWDSQHSTDI